MRKNKYIQIFNYLREFSKIRSKPVRDIEAQVTQYPEKLWLIDIPENQLIENIIRPDFNHDNDYWINVKKPKEPIKPKFAELSENLELWVERQSLFNEDDGPILKEFIVKDEEEVFSESLPELKHELNKYIENQWLDDLIEYKEKLEIYNNEYKDFEALNDIYKHLFKIFNRVQQFGEEYELVICVGLLNFKENEESPKIFRHVLTQRVDIEYEYSKKDSQILVAPNLESVPQIETDSIIDLYDQFDSQNIVDAEKAVEDYIKERNIETVFSNTDDILQMFAERISPDGSFLNIIEKPTSTPEKPKISISPALILRKRNTRSFTALYDKIIQNIENSNEDLEINTINDLIGDYTESDSQFVRSSSLDQSHLETIYFPKEYNNEQIEIVEKARKNNKVLVQGPPGTGKSHTIANLICHLLANGKKVLITAYTKRALEVLKEKLPPEFQDLAVNLLSGDASSIQELQSSVNSINDEISRANLEEYQAELDSIEERLKNIRESIAKTSNNLISIKEKATRTHELNREYKGNLTEIARLLESDSSLFEWYKDDYCEIENEELFQNLEEFIVEQENYKQTDTSRFEYDTINPEMLISFEHLKQYSRLKDEHINSLGQDDTDFHLNCLNFEFLIEKLSRLQNLYKEIKNVQIDFTLSILESFKAERSNIWVEKIDQSKEVLLKLDKVDFRHIDKDIEVLYPQDKSLKQIKKDAQTLLNYLKEGNPISGVSFSFKKPFLPKDIKERLYFIEAVRVNGSPCDTIEEFEVVLRDIGLKQDFIELEEIWDKEAPKGISLVKKYAFFKRIINEVTRLLNLIDHVVSVKSEIEGISNLNISLFDEEELKLTFLKAEYEKRCVILSDFDDELRNSIAYLNNGNFPSIKVDILKAYDNLDFHSYAGLLQKLKKWSLEKNEFKKFKDLRSDLSLLIPNTLNHIEGNSFQLQDISKLRKAIYFRNAQYQLEKLMDIKFENELVQHLIDSENKERKLIAKLASKKAWYKVVESLQNNRALRQHLDAWVMAVKKIGKTGKGKRAIKFRKIAQKEMERCKDSVPCWIMPLYKVAETVQPLQGMYDYVIIDEASQLGPDAIFLLYISQNVIIVGDDKQTSPEYVGVNANSMTPHIDRHLNGIPYKNFYGTEFSFFDHAKFFCDGVTVLREHFRCMPEIIEFSNRNFYAPDGKGLYPLKQYSEQRLEPLMTQFCSDGYVNGKGSRIINEPEAESIVETIGKIIENNSYAGKTIGVITLQGNQQASLIENLLLKRIGEKEFHKRKIVCGNSSSFQGDERDVIFLSMVTAHNHNRSSLVKPEDERRFNVAVSRAKEQIWLFHSVQLDDLSNTNDLRYKLLNHFKNYDSYQKVFNEPIKRQVGNQPEPFDSWFEVDVYNDIVNKQLSVIPQYEVAKGRYKIDLVTLFPDGTKIAIECDGDKWHGPEQYQNDLLRQKILERCGWQFFRVRGYEYYSNREKALEPLWEMIPNFEDNGEEISKDVDFEESTTKDSQKEEVEITSSSEALNDKLDNLSKHTEKPNLKIDNKEELRSGKILRYFNLFKSGSYVLTENKPMQADYVIPISENDANGYLLQLYNSGHVNKVYISGLLSKKIGRKYMNGLNRQGTLVDIQVIESDKILGIYFVENGRRKFKAHLTENISTREQLHLQGIKVIYNDFESIEFKIFQLEMYNDIERLVFQSFTANGKPIDNSYYESEWLAIKQILMNKKLDKSSYFQVNQNSLFND